MNFGRTLRQMRSQVGQESGADTIHLGKEDLFFVLADSRRRFVIERLADGDRDPPTCSELAVEIAADETHMPVEQVPPRRVQPVEDDLRAEQLPRLDDAGVVRWEGGDGEVRPGHSIGATARLLHEIDRRLCDQSTFDDSPFSVDGSFVDGRFQPRRSNGGHPRP